ncbi:hypothetical protein GCM10009765_48480 [Fodinicola feengrottensis]|uniref:Uncharacterized protein n=1 Tax=Fodinicola feengrottensis TaxID=435914 RepID=A0ABN2HTW8_9ACTN
MSEFSDDLDVALERVIHASKVHLDAVRSGHEPAIAEAFSELAAASEVYGARLRSATGEVTPWRPVRASRRKPDPATLVHDGMTVSVRKRRDYTVPNVDDLLAAATDIRNDTFSAGGADVHWSDLDADISDVGEAIYELLQAADGSLAGLDIPELWAGAGLIMVNAVPRPLDLTEDDDQEDLPFLLGRRTAVLMRIDEQVQPADPEQRDPFDDDGA